MHRASPIDLTVCRRATPAPSVPANPAFLSQNKPHYQGFLPHLNCFTIYSRLIPPNTSKIRVKTRRADHNIVNQKPQTKQFLKRKSAGEKKIDSSETRLKLTNSQGPSSRYFQNRADSKKITFSDLSELSDAHDDENIGFTNAALDAEIDGMITPPEAKSPTLIKKYLWQKEFENDDKEGSGKRFLKTFTRGEKKVETVLEPSNSLRSDLSLLKKQPMERLETSSKDSQITAKKNQSYESDFEDPSSEDKNQTYQTNFENPESEDKKADHNIVNQKPQTKQFLKRKSAGEKKIDSSETRLKLTNSQGPSSRYFQNRADSKKITFSDLSELSDAHDDENIGFTNAALDAEIDGVITPPEAKSPTLIKKYLWQKEFENDDKEGSGKRFLKKFSRAEKKIETVLEPTKSLRSDLSLVKKQPIEQLEKNQGYQSKCKTLTNDRKDQVSHVQDYEDFSSIDAAIDAEIEGMITPPEAKSPTPTKKYPWQKEFENDDKEGSGKRFLKKFSRAEKK
ncbi:hypothetical protein WMY93_024833 [Mugilogobius chulae]|uniref:Uncharacterized protein n=1 Tax=Mugilogobius chulae TaxID=88201 RepID=A0AAW0N414_9GOBI